MGLSATLQDVKDLLRRLDRNGDGLIDYGEFIDAAFVATKGRKKKTRWGKRNPLRSISPCQKSWRRFSLWKIEMEIIAKYVRVSHVLPWGVYNLSLP